MTRPHTKVHSNRIHIPDYPFIELTDSKAVQKWIDQLSLYISDGFEVWNSTDNLTKMIQMSLENQLLCIMEEEEKKDGECVE